MGEYDGDWWMMLDPEVDQAITDAQDAAEVMHGKPLSGVHVGNVTLAVMKLFTDGKPVAKALKVAEEEAGHVLTGVERGRVIVGMTDVFEPAKDA